MKNEKKKLTKIYYKVFKEPSESKKENHFHKYYSHLNIDKVINNLEIYFK